MLLPRPLPVASITTVFVRSTAPRERIDSQAGTIISAANNKGPKKVEIRNHLVRTRSVYSRSKTAQSLPMAADTLLHTFRAYALQKDLVERRLNQLEPLHARAGSDYPAQQLLCVGTGRELELVESVVLIGTRNE